MLIESIPYYESLKIAFAFAFSILPFVLPIILWPVVFDLYMEYKRLRFISKLDAVLLEIVLPQEVERSAQAMELVLNAMAEANYGTMTEVYIDGKVRPWFSLELVSQGGSVRFFIWTWTKFKVPIENAMYSQFPGVEVRVAPDYTKVVAHDPSERFVWGCHYKLDKDDAFPIKSYMDFGIEKNPDEEVKIDPMTPMLEYLGSIAKHEKVWIQILIRAHKPTTWRQGDWKSWRWFVTEEKEIEENGKKKKIKVKKWKPGNDETGWKERVDKAIEKIKKDATQEGIGGFKMVNFEPGQDDDIKTIRRHQSKQPFETLVRGFYIAEGNLINPSNITNLIGCIKQYAGTNKLKLGNYTDISDDMKDLLYFVPFQKIKDYYMLKKRWEMEDHMLDAYKKRSIFYTPHEHEGQTPYVMSAETIATLFHPVGTVAQTPTLERLDAKKSEPPSNLPV